MHKLLYNMNKSPSPNCLFCDDTPETLIHLFCQCPKVVNFWTEVEDWVASKRTLLTNFTPSEIILGYLKDENFVPINVIIMLTKSYIYTKANTTAPLILRELKKILPIYNLMKNNLIRIGHYSEISSEHHFLYTFTFFL